MTFRIDPHAARLPEGPSGLTRQEVSCLLPGAQFLCEQVTDSGMDRFSLTRGGQLLRQTGIDGRRFQVMPPDEGYDFVAGIADESVLDDLREVFDSHGIEYGAAPAPAM